MGLAVVAAASLAQANAAVILSPGASYSYSTDLGATWNLPSPAPFGNTTGGDFGANTSWPASGNMWVQTTIDLTGYDLSSIQYDLGVDNGYDLFLNNNHVAGANAEGFTYRWEYSGAISSAFLHSGNNALLVKLEDHGGLTAFDMQITGNLAAVPEPSTYFAGMTALGMLCLFGRRNRK